MMCAIRTLGLPSSAHLDQLVYPVMTRVVNTALVPMMSFIFIVAFFTVQKLQLLFTIVQKL